MRKSGAQARYHHCHEPRRRDPRQVNFAQADMFMHDDLDVSNQFSPVPEGLPMLCQLFLVLLGSVRNHYYVCHRKDVRYPIWLFVQNSTEEFFFSWHGKK